MKILVCTDGSDQSQKALDKAVELAEGFNNVDEVAIIHIYEHAIVPIGVEGAPEVAEDFMKWQEKNKEEAKKILSKALELFEGKNVKTRTIFKEGHPSSNIVSVAREEGFDTIIIGNRGMSGIKKALLGSVSSAVVQEATDCSIIIVK